MCALCGKKRGKEQSLIDMQEIQERGLVIEGLKQMLVALDQFAANVDAQP